MSAKVADPKKTAIPVLFARLYALVLSAIQLPFLTQQLPPSEYAFVVSAMAAATFFSLVSGDPVTLAFKRFPGEDAGSETFNYSAKRLAVTLGLVSAIGATVAYATGTLNWAVAIIGWGVGLAAMRFVSTAWLMWHQTWRYAANITASGTARTTALVILVWTGMDVMFALGIAGILSALAAVVLGPRARMRWSAIQANRRGQVRPWPAWFGANLALASLATTTITMLDRMILPLFSPEAEAGQFASMTQVAVLTLGGILGLVQTSLYPTVQTRWNTEARLGIETATNSLAYTNLIASLAILGVVGLGSFTVRPVIGEEYYNSAMLIAAMCAVTIQSQGIQSAWLSQLRLRASRVSRVATTAAAINVILLFALIPWLGAKGALTASLVAYSVIALKLQFRDFSPSVAAQATLLPMLAGVAALANQPALTAVVAVAMGMAAGFQLGARHLNRGSEN